MKVAAVKWIIDKRPDLDLFEEKVYKYIEHAAELGVSLLVFPAQLGNLYKLLLFPGKSPVDLVLNDCYDRFLEIFCGLSKKYGLGICPGSYYLQSGNDIYHVSCFIEKGKIIFEQKQIYLSRWEKGIGLKRGFEQKYVSFQNFNVGIVLGTDVFYPQVSRALVLQGVNLILAPVSFIGEPNFWIQISGMWNNVQQNQIFAVESGFNGNIADKDFWGQSLIHAPVEITSQQNGFLAMSSERDFIYTTLDEIEREKLIKQCNYLSLLNPLLYRKMNMFGG